MAAIAHEEKAGEGRRSTSGIRTTARSQELYRSEEIGDAL